MDQKHLLSVIAIGVAAVFAGVSLNQSNQGDSQFEQTALLALNQSAFDINQVDEIKLIDAGERVIGHAKQLAGKWILPLSYGYAADVAQLKKLLQTINDSNVVELKTSNEAKYHRLGLRDVTNSESTATKLVLRQGESQLELLIGNSAKSGTGQYVRYVNQPQTYLINKGIDLPEARTDWLVKTIFSIDYEQVTQLEVQPVEGEKFTISRQFNSDKNTNFKQKNTETKVSNNQLKYPSIFNGLVRNLVSITAEGVMPTSEFVSQDISPVIPLVQFELAYLGEEIKNLRISVSSRDDAYWLKVKGGDWYYRISKFDYKQVSKGLDAYFEADIEQ